MTSGAPENPTAPMPLVRCLAAILVIGVSLPIALRFALEVVGLVLECVPARGQPVGRDGYLGDTLLNVGSTVGTWQFLVWGLWYTLPVLALAFGVTLLRGGRSANRLFRRLMT
jgi:hypothetical protein